VIRAEQRMRKPADEAAAHAAGVGRGRRARERKQQGCRRKGYRVPRVTH
jgi:hypothetical protein